MVCPPETQTVMDENASITLGECHSLAEHQISKEEKTSL